MNPMTRASLSRIEGSIATLRAGIQDLQEQLQTQAEAREKLLKDFWNKTKEASVLKEEQAKFAEVKGENARLKAAHEELEQRLETVLSCTKSLIHDFHA
jgi:predicted nuclease with TOPRIM domain